MRGECLPAKWVNKSLAVIDSLGKERRKRGGLTGRKVKKKKKRKKEERGREREGTMLEVKLAEQVYQHALAASRKTMLLFRFEVHRDATKDKAEETLLLVDGR